VSSSEPHRRRSAARKFLVRNDGAHQPDDSSPGSDDVSSGGGSPAATSNGIARDDERYDTPAYVLGLSDPHVLERFEQLDDTVFEAIAGKSSAVDDLRRLWAEIPQIVGPQLVEESRQAYLHHALNKWSECNSAEEHRNPRLAATLLDVIAVLVGSP
jgi:hypothetical protein